MATNTAEKQQTAPADGVKGKGEVAVFQKPRLPFDPILEERFGDIGVNRTTWKALVESVFPAAKTADAIALALSYCKARKLDPFKRVVHIVPIWDSTRNREVETVWPGIAEHRTTAFRTRQYAGADPTAFGPMIEHTFSGDIGRDERKQRRNIPMRFPEWAQITIYRMIDGQRVPFPGPRCYWMEYYSRMGKSALPNDRWQRAPIQMIEKCAEAAALRRAFPEELGDEPTDAESGYYGSEPDAAASDARPPRPQRKDFVDAEIAAPEFTVITSDGEIRTFAEPKDACDALSKLLGAAISIGAEAVDGAWESNQTLLAELSQVQCEEMAEQLAREHTAARAKAKPTEKKAEAEAIKEPPSPLHDKKAPWPPRVDWIKARLKAMTPVERAEFLAVDPDISFISENRRADWQAIELLVDDLRNEGK